MAGSLIVAAARTPIGRFAGALAPVPAPALGGRAIAAALDRAGLAPDAVDHVLMGLVLQAGNGQVPARQAAVAAGMPWTVPANTLNKACLSGLNALIVADQMIATGEADVVVAGGMESMSRAPYLLPGARDGYRMGDRAAVDSLLHDGLHCAYDHIHMGEATDRDLAARPEITRPLQDEYAAQSHERAAAAQKAGRLATEIAPVAVPARGEPVQVDEDEGIRPGTTVETLGRLRAVFLDGGSVTAGNASQISDGAAALVVASRAAVDRLGLTPRAELLGAGMVAGPDRSLLSQPARAIRRAAERAGITTSDVDLLEINEAFAAVVLASMADLGIDDERVNVNGGAIALGHPIGASGARIVVSLIDELHRRGGGVGAAGLCGAGGQGDAVVIRTL